MCIVHIQGEDGVCNISRASLTKEILEKLVLLKNHVSTECNLGDAGKIFQISLFLKNFRKENAKNVHIESVFYFSY